MFESLQDRLSGVFSALRGRGKLNEKDVDQALREVRRALLEADVNVKVARDFIAKVKERAVGEELWKSLTPGQLVVKHVRDELTELMGGENHQLAQAEGKPTAVMIVGLNGAGKTTSSGKLAKLLKRQGRKPLLAATDVYRPAAIEQLQTLGKQIKIPVFSLGTQKTPQEIAQAAMEHAKDNHFDTVIIDTAGRLQVDEELMKELKQTNDLIKAEEILLVADAMTGQEAVNIAQEFNTHVSLTGIILTKMDGDARGGAALSMRQATGAPIKFVGLGEKVDAFEPFYPDRIASRILGMGDVLSLIEKAEENLDREAALELEKKILQNDFNLEDFLKQMRQIKKLGPLQDLIKMIPGVGNNPALKNMQVDESKFGRLEAMILSMTPAERQQPKILNGSRKKRIAKGSGVEVSELNILLQQFQTMQKMMQKMAGGGQSPPGKGKGRRKGKKKRKGPRMPFNFSFKK